MKRTRLFAWFAVCLGVLVCTTTVFAATDVERYRKAAEQGDAEAQFKLGVRYINGQGVDQSYTEAVKWFRKAAEQGDADAQYNLGLGYEYGQGVEQSYTESAKW